jgi:hypothetical protein
MGKLKEIEKELRIIDWPRIHLTSTLLKTSGIT